MYRFNTKGIRSKKIKIEANGSRITLLVLKPESERLQMHRESCGFTAVDI